MKCKYISFYKYVFIADPAGLQKELTELCGNLFLRGKIYLANEGINAAMCGQEENVDAFMATMHQNQLFSDLLFKQFESKENTFRAMHIRIKKEIVNSGLGDIDSLAQSKRITPTELNELYHKNDDFVILDTRNTYESKIGKFKNALTPEMTNFREWKAVVDSLPNEYRDKKVVTYCTGGIRCEKASRYLAGKGFNDVYQLDGGIITYIQQYPDTNWEGGVFVFDDRKVLEPNTDPKLKYTSNCEICGAPTANYINCHNLECDKIFVCCPNCKTTYDYCCSKECHTATKKRDKYYD